MMAKKQDQLEPAHHEEKFSEMLFLNLLRTVPVDQFVRMVGHSGMPAEQARKLCQLFKRFKA